MRDWLRNKRLEKQLTQAQLAKIVGADATMISKIEVGERRPSVELAKKIAEALGFDWTRFYE
jgi:transcriptional regulator with XRE-family HTH domain